MDEVRLWSSYRPASLIRQKYTAAVLPPLRARPTALVVAVLRGNKGGGRERMPDALSTKVRRLHLACGPCALHAALACG